VNKNKLTEDQNLAARTVGKQAASWTIADNFSAHFFKAYELRVQKEANKNLY
jgi:hypothetical protein